MPTATGVVSARFDYRLNANVIGDTLKPCNDGGNDLCYQSAVYFPFNYVLEHLPDSLLGQELKIGFRASLIFPGKKSDIYPDFGESICFDDLTNASENGVELDSISSVNTPDTTVTVQFSPTINFKVNSTDAVLSGGICIVVETLDPTSPILPRLLHLGTPYLESTSTVVSGTDSGSAKLPPTCDRCSKFVFALAEESK
ncbi:MAG: hypothetical protein AAGN35_11875 [Bacteroidota bacterium]